MGILRHFPFSSIAQRQSVIVETVGREGEIVVLTKGAPEAIAWHCDPHTVPKDFDEKLNYFAKQVRLKPRHPSTHPQPISAPVPCCRVIEF